MNENKKKSFKWWGIILLGVYPIISLYQLNIAEIGIIYIIRPLIAGIVFTFIAYGLFFLLFKHQGKAFITSFITSIILTSYGALYNLINGWQFGMWIFGRHRFLVFIVMLVLLGIIWGISKIKTPVISNLEKIAAMICIIMVVLPIFQISLHYQKIRFPDSSRINNKAVISTAPNNHPDVYYFLLDSYAREDYIKSKMDYDNSGFISQLEMRGFQVVDCSLSNFTATRLSLSSSLNLDYVQNLDDSLSPSNKDASILDPYIQKSKVVKYFEDLGYTTIAYETGYPFTELTNSDYYIRSIANPIALPYITEFEALVMNNTILAATHNIPFIEKKLGLSFPYKSKYNRQKFILNNISSTLDIPGPKFYFIHLVTNHRPYIFDSDGSILTDKNYYLNDGVPIDDNYYISGYQKSLDFTNPQIITNVDKIIYASKVKPIILLQGDHGVRSPGRISIFLSVYGLSENTILPENLSPVNLFRFVFNDRFGENYPLLPNHYYSSNVNKDPFNFEEFPVTDPCKIY